MKYYTSNNNCNEKERERERERGIKTKIKKIQQVIHNTVAYHPLTDAQPVPEQ